MKTCSRCKETKSVSEFSKHHRNKDGLQDWCKSCIRAYRQSEKSRAANRKAVAKFFLCHPNHRKAKNAVNYAICAGRLPRPDSLPCYYCPKPAQQYHHWHGYEPEHWLDVVPACVECHTKEHRKIACGV